ncbi:hypothetical protein EVAR_92680_1 [Eumeta japonica]|uniref:Uncharacterized protein n=1 Tax=Eumeta variegata TaxID=151549 RepID=A0A4C1T0F9_EUMVA|nr:hypothetical protein EVAR_92680_1 [Eumeta japonica]
MSNANRHFEIRIIETQPIVTYVVRLPLKWNRPQLVSFGFRKWTSNSAKLLSDIARDHLEKPHVFDNADGLSNGHKKLRKVQGLLLKLCWLKILIGGCGQRKKCTRSRTQLNPIDIVNHGCDAAELLMHPLWWLPEWLQNTENSGLKT